MDDIVSLRQSEILDLAKDVGRVGVDALANRFDVTPQTIRRDLNELCDRNLLNRVHGGAVFPSGVANYKYHARRNLAADEKRRIGERAASIIPDHCSVIVNIGTTTEQVARALHGHTGLLVITNNINVVEILKDNEGTDVLIVGGLVRSADGGVVGESAVDFIKQFRADFAIVGASALDEDGAMLDYDYREVRVSQAILKNARHPILVADSMKFDRTAPVRIGHISDVRSFVTDQLPPEAFREICVNSGVSIELAETEGAAVHHV